MIYSVAHVRNFSTTSLPVHHARLPARALLESTTRGAFFLRQPLPRGHAIPNSSWMYAVMYMRRWGVKIMSMSESRANYAATLDSVINDQEEVVITRPGGEDVVMIPRREYESMRETLYLMSSPVNRQRISRSIEQLDQNRGQVRELIDPDGDDG